MNKTALAITGLLIATIADLVVTASHIIIRECWIITVDELVISKITPGTAYRRTSTYKLRISPHESIDEAARKKVDKLTGIVHELTEITNIERCPD